jgi:predicted acyl esterase
MAKEDFEYIWRPGVNPAERKYPGFGPKTERIKQGIVVDRDVAVPMRDGVKLYVDVYRPDAAQKVPALVAWSPYGKHAPGGYDRFFKQGGVKPEWTSKYSAFEGPDPLYWVPHGYAVVNVDTRGVWHSEGEGTFWNHAEGRDGHDLIEHLAVQDWCSGKLALTGVSYLAIAQWQIAATRPPHLAAINPWEGVSDVYREFAFHAGIPDSFFVPLWNSTGVNSSLTRVEDMVEMMKKHPLWDAYWETKRANLKNITCPAYVVASWTDQGLHTRGTLEGYKQISSKQKWLEVHGRKKWEYFLNPASVEKQRKFFDCFLKGLKNEVLDWPRVLVEAREKFYTGKFRAENEWPIARTQYRKLFLDARTGKMKPAPYPAKSRVSYAAPGEGAHCPSAYREDRAEFNYKFAKATELIGHMKLRLWMAADGADDMDIFVAVQKFDKNGRYVPFAAFNAMEDGPVALGWMRASHRELDESLSTPEQPWLLHKRELKLKPGQVVPLEIEVWPSGTRFAAGESLRVVVQGSDIYRYAEWIRMHGHRQTLNKGRHVIHTGGKHDSHLLIPIVPPKR